VRHRCWCRLRQRWSGALTPWRDQFRVPWSLCFDMWEPRVSIDVLSQYPGDQLMGLAQYSIVPVRDQWGVLHDGNVSNEYATKEAAFEAAVAAASLAIREGHEVHVSVPGNEKGKSS
jgi:hypothetical protein